MAERTPTVWELLDAIRQLRDGWELIEAAETAIRAVAGVEEQLKARRADLAVLDAALVDRRAVLEALEAQLAKRRDAVQHELDELNAMVLPLRDSLRRSLSTL